MRCPDCRKKNSARSRYCVRCGEELPAPATSASSKLPWVIVGVLIVGMIAIALNAGHDSSTEQVTTRTPQFSAATLAVAANFSCACGSCDDDDLKTCECPIALEEKAFIASQLNAGVEVEQIIDQVAKKYGGLTQG